jgi:DNA adenine methylase
MPKEINNYYEPFLGSGSVLLYVMQQQMCSKIKILNNVVACDFNEDLINFFKKLQRAPLELHSEFNNELIMPFNCLQSFEDKKTFYELVRSDFNANLGLSCVTQAARFLFLNKTCFGGKFSVNSKGFFNVSFGRRKPAFPSLNILINVSNLIGSVNFLHQKFDPEMKLKAGDYVYLDPPYIKLTGSSFNSYVSSGFSDGDSLSVLRFCEKLPKKGC